MQCDDNVCLVVVCSFLRAKATFLVEHVSMKVRVKTYSPMQITHPFWYIHYCFES